MEPTEFHSETTGMQGLIFGRSSTPGRAYVYLHGLGEEFRGGIEGHYKYPGFATALRNDEVSTPHPFVLPCDRGLDIWVPEKLNLFLTDLEKESGKLSIDLIGYSRGGSGVYDYIARYSDVRTATVINSKLPTSTQYTTNVPLQIIHSRKDHLETVASVREFCNCLRSDGMRVTFKERDGDHFIIHPVALDPEFYRWIEDGHGALDAV